jgi:TIR domain
MTVVYRSLRVPEREAISVLEKCDRDGALADHEYESSDAAGEGFESWQRATAEALYSLFADRQVGNDFRSGMNVGASRRASAMFADRREKLLRIQSDLILRDLNNRRGELLVTAHQVASHDALLLLDSADAEKPLTRQIHAGEELLAETSAPDAMNDRSYQAVAAKEKDYRTYNVQLLRAIFDRNSVADAFDAETRPFEIQSHRRKIDWENCREIDIDHCTDPKKIMVERILRQVNELTRLRGNLSVFPRLGSPAPQPSGSLTSMSSMSLFISHSSRDAALAKALVELIEKAMKIPAAEIRCTSVDGYGLPVGAETKERLRAEIFDTRVFIGLITPASMRSAYVLFELGARWGAGRQIAPVLGRGADASILGDPLRDINALSLTERNQVLQLVEDLARGLGRTLEPMASFQGAVDVVVAAAQTIDKSAQESNSPESDDIGQDELGLLQLLAEQEGLTSTEMAQIRGIKTAKAEYLLDEFERRDIVGWVGAADRNEYFLEQAGRAILVRKGLL